MKVVVAAAEGTLTARVDSRFGRAPLFVLYDTETEAVESVENKQNRQAVQGAGIQAAQTVIEAGADAVIVGNCGPKAFRVLKAGDVAVYAWAEGTVAEAVKLLVDGKLTESGGANVEGHW